MDIVIQTPCINGNTRGFVYKNLLKNKAKNHRFNRRKSDNINREKYCVI